MQNIFIILLGCNVYSILMNRLETSFNFIESLNKNFKIEFDNYHNEKSYYDNNNIIINPLNQFDYNTLGTNYTIYSDKFINKNIKITWFLSGGIKFSQPGAKSEASEMKSYIDKIINRKFYSSASTSVDSNINWEWDFVLDEQSTNTAENFIRASNFLNQTTNTYDSVYIVTSDFHFDRASKMIKLIDPSREFKWILGDAEEKNSRHMEKIHIQNVYSDVVKAKIALR